MPPAPAEKLKLPPAPVSAPPVAPSTVRMHNPDTDKTADVHPDEVDNWKAVGWRVSEG